MEETQIKVLADDEVWRLGLVTKALAACEKGDLLVGVVEDNGEYFAIIYTVAGTERYLHRIKL